MVQTVSLQISRLLLKERIYSPLKFDCTSVLVLIQHINTYPEIISDFVL